MSAARRRARQHFCAPSFHAEQHSARVQRLHIVEVVGRSSKEVGRGGMRRGAGAAAGSGEGSADATPRGPPSPCRRFGQEVTQFPRSTQRGVKCCQPLWGAGRSGRGAAARAAVRQPAHAGAAERRKGAATARCPRPRGCQAAVTGRRPGAHKGRAPALSSPAPAGLLPRPRRPQTLPNVLSHAFSAPPRPPAPARRGPRRQPRGSAAVEANGGKGLRAWGRRGAEPGRGRLTRGRLPAAWPSGCGSWRP
jgi:hypothetical protein